MFNVNEIRKDFPILKTKTNSGNDLIYFDNSATTLKPKVVIDAVSNYYEKIYIYSNWHCVNDNCNLLSKRCN